jgi:hypothetical protein
VILKIAPEEYHYPEFKILRRLRHNLRVEETTVQRDISIFEHKKKGGPPPSEPSLLVSVRTKKSIWTYGGYVKIILLLLHAVSKNKNSSG